MTLRTCFRDQVSSPDGTAHQQKIKMSLTYRTSNIEHNLQIRNCNDVKDLNKFTIAESLKFTVFNAERVTRMYHMFDVRTAEMFREVIQRPRCWVCSLK
jgi:hypothetical protein